LKKYRGHGVVPLTELRSNREPSAIQIAIPFCEDYDKQLKYHCEICDELVCMHCTVKKQNDSMKNMASKHWSQLKSSPLQWRE